MAVAAAATALIATSATPASAHVTVSSPDASPGGFGKLVFRVPTESDTASTTKLTVTLPTDTPFAFVSTKPVPGWKVETTEQKLEKPIEVEGFKLSKVVSTVTWTAEGGAGLGPGQFGEFELSVGPFPEKTESKDVGSLTLPATQTYSDGEVVKWDQPTPEGGEEPELPAPTLALSGESTSAHGADAKPAATQPASSADSSDSLARWLGAGGLLLGVVAVGLALTSRRRST